MLPPPSGEFLPPADDRTVYGPPRLRLLALVGTCLLAMAILWIPAWYGSPVMRGVGWFGIALLTPAVLVLLVRTFRPGATLVIDEHGITDRTALTPTGLIRWEEITVVRKREIGRGSLAERLLEVVLTDPDGFRRARSGRPGWRLLAAWRALLKQPMIGIPASMVSAPLPAVMAEIRRRRPELQVLEGPPPAPTKFRALFPARGAQQRQRPRRGDPDLPRL